MAEWNDTVDWMLKQEAEGTLGAGGTNYLKWYRAAGAPSTQEEFRKFTGEGGVAGRQYDDVFPQATSSPVLDAAYSGVQSGQDAVGLVDALKSGRSAYAADTREDSVFKGGDGPDIQQLLQDNASKYAQDQAAYNFMEENNLASSQDGAFLNLGGFNPDAETIDDRYYQLHAEGPIGEYNVVNRERPQGMSAEQVMKIATSLALASPAGLGTLAGSLGGGFLGGAAGGAAISGAQQAMWNELDAAQLGKDALTGGLMGSVNTVAGDIFRPADGLTTTDLGKLIGENGLLSGIPELDISYLQDAASFVGDKVGGAYDALMGASTETEYAQMPDGTKLYPDADGYITTPDGIRTHMTNAQQGAGGLETFKTVPGKGILHNIGVGDYSVGGALDSFADTTITPIADEIFGDKAAARYREKFYDFESERAANLNWDNELYNSPGGYGNTFLEAISKIGDSNNPPPPEEDPSGLPPSVFPEEGTPPSVGTGAGSSEALPEEQQDEGVAVLPSVEDEDLLRGDSELLGTGGSGAEDILADGDGESVVPLGGEEIPVTGSETLPSTGATGGEDTVAQSEEVPPATTSGPTATPSPAPTPSKRAAARKAERFRLARIMEIEGLDPAIKGQILQRLVRMAEEDLPSVEGDVTKDIDPETTAYLSRIEGDKKKLKRAERRELVDPDEAILSALRDVGAIA